MSRINSFGSYRVLGYDTATIGTTEVAIGAISRPSGCNGASIRLIANVGKKDDTAIVKVTVPLQPTSSTSEAAPDANLGQSVFDGEFVILWPDQLAAKMISADGQSHTAEIMWVALQ